MKFNLLKLTSFIGETKRLTRVSNHGMTSFISDEENSQNI